MTAATFLLDPVTVELRDWLAAAVLTGAPSELPFPVGDSQAPLDGAGQPLPPPYGVLWQLGTVRPAPPYAGATEVLARWQVSTVGGSPSQARHYADRVRAAWAGEDGDGAQTAMDLTGAGVAALARRSAGDGALDYQGGLWVWAETFEIDLAPAG